MNDYQAAKVDNQKLHIADMKILYAVQRLAMSYRMDNIDNKCKGGK